ncbi:hypothetical protein B0T25DRAFT_568784 [Lasiosphaeria hispida]|uniref:DUF6546 domain-containing protein n=1 Tax=Lasiosphaeria hispida TaxID=260671 RepID=A0AAJ0MEM2_9PEZI|nr:hypothetical protein B0T25DRAFT_568784 [Lasiosphaeria hispida]
MPKLQVMELWNGRPGFACIFRYYRNQETQGWKPTLTLLSTWDLNPEPRVIEAWEKVAEKHGVPFQLVVDVSTLPPSSVFKCCGSMLHLLELKELILQPTSMCQI